MHPTSFTLCALALLVASCSGGPDTNATDAAPYVEVVHEVDTYIKASDTTLYDFFGQVVAVSEDRIGVGSPERGNAEPRGAVYVFERDGTSWRQDAILETEPELGATRFGSCLAIDGDTLVVQARAALNRPDFVRILRRNGGVWEQEAELRPSTVGFNEGFGCPLELDGDTLAIGARGDRSNGTSPEDRSTPDSGAVYIFKRTDSTWAQESFLKAPNPDIGDRFGQRLALAGDTLAVSALGEDSASLGVDGDIYDNSSPDSGAVYVFARDAGLWQQEAYLKPPVAPAFGSRDFGISIALSDGKLAIGAPRETLPDAPEISAGGIYFYEKDGVAWSLESTLSGTSQGESLGSEFLYSGNSLILSRGARKMLLINQDGVWGNESFLESNNGTTLEAMAWSGSTVVVGGPQDSSRETGIDGNHRDTSTAGSGAAFVFELE